MTTFMDKDFLLNTETARKLYHDYAASCPIIDYHCHISPRRFGKISASRTSRRSGWAATTTSGA